MGLFDRFRSNSENTDNYIKKPNYDNFGLSNPMGEKLRKEVEKQLSDDIKHYAITDGILKFDWSESCIEGRYTKILEGHMDNFSDIKVFNSYDEFIAEGWIDFIHEDKYNLFMVYWDQLDLYANGELAEVKGFGIPDYIYDKLPNELKTKYRK